jgi:hypothetical protein
MQYAATVSADDVTATSGSPVGFFWSHFRNQPSCGAPRGTESSPKGITFFSGGKSALLPIGRRLVDSTYCWNPVEESRSTTSFRNRP